MFIKYQYDGNGMKESQLLPNKASVYILPNFSVSVGDLSALTDGAIGAGEADEAAVAGETTGPVSQTRRMGRL